MLILCVPRTVSKLPVLHLFGRCNLINQWLSNGMIIINHHQPHHTILMRRAMMIMTGTTISTMNPINGKNNYTCSLILPYTSIYSIMMYHLISLYLLSFVHHSPSLTTHQSFHHPIAQAQRQPWPPWRCSPDDQNQARKKGRFIRYR